MKTLDLLRMSLSFSQWEIHHGNPPLGESGNLFDSICILLRGSECWQILKKKHRKKWRPKGTPSDSLLSSRIFPWPIPWMRSSRKVGLRSMISSDLAHAAAPKNGCHYGLTMSDMFFEAKDENQENLRSDQSDPYMDRYGQGPALPLRHAEANRMKCDFLWPWIFGSGIKTPNRHCLVLLPTTGSWFS